MDRRVQGNMMTSSAALYSELWVSFASLLRSYTAAHGLNNGRHAAIDFDDNLIMVRHEEKWLKLVRDGASVAWMRENGISGHFELTVHGRLRRATSSGSGNLTDEEEMDMAAEAWARELMQ
jgi:hypothetical protein